jgi:pimeloyl-ACP methyl ester carboxylesterase
LRRGRDLVFVDLRGTGESNRLSCTSTADRSNVQNYFAEIFEPATIRACRAALGKRADLRLYTTAMAVDDLEEVRLALGYDKINLYGVSYGTLAALQYLRRYPQPLRSIVLAGVLTPAAKLPLHFAKAGHRALERLFDDCGADESCRAAYPNLRSDFARVLAAFDNGPVNFELAHPVTKDSQTVSLSRGVFTERLRAMLHSHESARLIPLLIDHAARGNWTPFGKIAVTSTTAAAFDIASGVYYSVSCSESVPTISEEDIARENTPTFLGDYRTRRHQQACALWQRGDVPADFHEPVKSEKPILILSGDVDPATPREVAEDALSSLPNGRQIVLRNMPHSYSSECARSMIVEFISKGSARDIAAGCAARFRRPPFLTELPARYNR